MSLQHVADAFWTNVRDPEIADVLFGHARWLQRNKHGVGPTDEAAAKHYKGDLSRAVAVARSRTVDPEILRKFAKDPRVSVRQELLENPNTPRDVIVGLTVWKFERRDNDLVDCAERLTLAELLDVFDRFSAEHGERDLETLDLPAADLIPRLTAEPAMAVRLARTAPLSFVALVAEAAHDGFVPGVSLSEILDARPAVTERSLQIILTDRKHLTQELATRWRAWRDDPETRVYRHFGFDTRLFERVEDGAADILADGDVAQLHTAVLHGASDHVLAQAFATSDVEKLRHVVEVLDRRALSREAETALVDRILVVGGLGKFPLHDLLEGLRHRLDDTRLVGLLRLGGVLTLNRWLTASYSVNGPRPGIIPVLAANPRWRAANHDGAVDLTAAELVTGLVIGGNADPAIAAEIVTLHDDHIGRNLNDTGIAAMVYPLLEQAFAGPEKRASWETFLTLASDWSDTFTGLVDTVHGLLGTTPQETPVRTSASNTPEQLTLL